MDLILIPLIGYLVLFFAIRRHSSAPFVALAFTVANLALTLSYWARYDAGAGTQFITDLNWIPEAGIHFKIGLDGISLLLVLLTNLLLPLIILSTLKRGFSGSFYGMVLLMQMALNGVFMALDGIVFYVFWELALIPIYLICAMWGGENRIRITLKFFIYTFAGSLMMLVALLYVYTQTPEQSFDIQQLYAAQLSPEAATWVSLAMFLAFAIKMPVFPFHTWQPDTYTTAPTGGAMLLSGIMLKMGIYGVIRWMIPMVPEAPAYLNAIYIALAVTGIIYASVIAIRLNDFKRLIAYSSIAHVGLIAAGVLVFNITSLQGGLIQMFNHGINVVGLFLICDILEHRAGTRNIQELGGIARKSPAFAVLFMIIALGTMAVPLTNGFVGELLLLKGLYEYGLVTTLLAGTTLILGAVYVLRALQYILFGPEGAKSDAVGGLQLNETIVLGILALIILLLGVYPQPLLDLTAASAAQLIQGQ